MTRRLLHALGYHWWTAWRDAVITDYFLYHNRLETRHTTFQRRTCRLCPAEQRRVAEV